MSTQRPTGVFGLPGCGQQGARGRLELELPVPAGPHQQVANALSGAGSLLHLVQVWRPGRGVDVYRTLRTLWPPPNQKPQSRRWPTKNGRRITHKKSASQVGQARRSPCDGPESAREPLRLVCPTAGHLPSRRAGGGNRSHRELRRGIQGFLDHALRVADPFHVVRVANRTVDLVRRRVQNQLLGHRGRKKDPLYRIRKLLAMGAERLSEQGHQRLLVSLRVGDPDEEVVGAGLAKESVRDILSDRGRRGGRHAARQGDCRLSGGYRRRDPVPRPDAEPLAAGDPEPSPHRRQQRTHRRTEPLR